MRRFGGGLEKWHPKTQRLYSVIPREPRNGEDALRAKTPHEAMAIDLDKQDSSGIRHARGDGPVYTKGRYKSRIERLS